MLRISCRHYRHHRHHVVLFIADLAQLETLIELETKKLDLLRRMRGHVLAGGELPAGMTANGDLEEYLARGGGGSGGSSSSSSSSDPRRSPRSAGRGDAGRQRDRDRDEDDSGSFGGGGRGRASSRGGRGETSADDLLMQVTTPLGATKLLLSHMDCKDSIVRRCHTFSTFS